MHWFSSAAYGPHNTDQQKKKNYLKNGEEKKKMGEGKKTHTKKSGGLKKKGKNKIFHTRTN